MNTYNLPVWDYLAKELIFRHLGNITGIDILDFGSGNGYTANRLAKNCRVTAVEPSDAMLSERICDDSYVQLKGSTEILKSLPDESIDLIICHNVLEYAPDRTEIVHEFSRILRKGGRLSLVKHNRYGRVMQMSVLLNNFDAANAILDGENHNAENFGTINYYDDCDIEKWCSSFRLIKSYGLRTFFDLQQNQEIQSDEQWQEQMLALEQKVSDLAEFKAIAFFHHLIFEKEQMSS